MHRLILALLLFLSSAPQLFAASARSPNFVVTADTQELADAAVQMAELKRAELARFWFGKEFPNWDEECRMILRVGDNVPASGMTRFIFNGGEVYGWEMEVNGNRRNAINSVIPHEVNHTVFATFFRRPLPRWADEGASSITEEETERALLRSYLNQVKGGKYYIPLRSLLTIEDYPKDNGFVGSLYAEGHSLTSFMLHKKSPGVFVQLLCDFPNKGWEVAIRDGYGYESIRELETAWLEWVVNGTPTAGSQPSDTRPSFVAFVTSSCPACDRFKADLQAGKFREYRVFVVYLDNGAAWCDLNFNGQIDPGELEQGKSLKADFEGKTGQRLAQVPVFWIPATVEYIIGFSEATQLVRWVGSTLKKLIGIIFHGEPAVVVSGPQQPIDPSTVTPIAPSVPDVPEPSPFTPEVKPEPEVVTPTEEPEEVDWGDVSVVILVSDTYNKARLLPLIRGPLTRKIEDLTDGRAAVLILSQSTEPDIYEKLIKLTDVSPEPIYALVLVGKKSLGLKGLIASRIESAFVSKHDSELSKAKIEIIFERTNQKAYNAVRDTIEADPPKVLMGLREILLATASGLFAGLIPSMWAMARGRVKQRAVSVAKATVSRVIPSKAEPIKPEEGLELTDG